MSKLIKGRRVGAALVQGRIDLPVQGISQQPPSSRPPAKCEDSTNTWPSPVEGLTRRRGTQLRRRVSANVITDLWSETILPVAGERYSFVLSNSGGSATLGITLDGVPCSVDVHGLGLSENAGSVIGTGSSYLYNASDLKLSYQLINSGAVALLLNRNIKTALTGDLSPASLNEALIFVQAVTFDVGYVVTLNGAALPEYRTPKASDTANTISTAATATELAARIAAATGFTSEVFGPLVYARRIDGGAFSLTLDDSRSGALARVLKDSTTNFSSLPASGRNGFIIKITSDPSTALDDYWVKFITNDSSAAYGDGGWVETVAPGIAYKFNPETFPLVIYRAALGVLFVGPADGQTRVLTVGSNAYSYTFPLWGQRTAGDATTVPTPSFIGQSIKDHLIFRGRYWTASKNSVVGSESDNPFNFFSDTSTTVLDTDPIDLLTPAESASIPSLEWLVATDESILAFSEADQFQIKAADQQVMTPRTAEILRLSSIAINVRIKPKLAGPNIIFSTNEQGYTGFREYQFIETQNRRLGINLGGSLGITSEVPRLINGLADLWDLSESLDFAVIVSPSDRKLAYVYKYLWGANEGSLQKKQSAWQVWTFPADIQWVRFYDNRLALILSYSDGTYLIDMAVSELRSGSAPDFCLDRSINFPECNSDAITTNNVAATYDAGSNRTTFVLPYVVAVETLAVVRFDNTRSQSLEIGRASTGNTIICTEPGDWRSDKITFGGRFTSSHTFSSPFPPAREGGRDQTGRLQLLSWQVFHFNSGPYKLRVRRFNRSADTVKAWSPRIANVELNVLNSFGGVLDSGRQRVIVGTRNTDSLVSVESDSIFPFTITGAAWEGAYNDRAQAIN
jgi:hypothetical protein